MKKIFFSLFLCAFSLAASSQSIECKKISTEKAADVPEGETAVRFVSKQGNWLIKPLEKNNVQDRVVGEDNSHTTFSYEYRADVTRDNERTFTVSKKGSPITQQVVAKNLRRGMRVTYSITEIADTLNRIELQSNGAIGLYPIENKACVEITTTLNSLDVSTGWEKSEEMTDAGARRITVIVDVEQLKNGKSQLQTLSMKMSELEQKGDYLAIEPIQKQYDDAEAWYESHSIIQLGGTGIKTLPLELEDLSQKEKRRYAVVALQESFEELITKARQMKKERCQHLDYGFYDAAVILYDKAIEHRDAPTSQLESLRDERIEMAEARKLIWLLGKAQEKADDAEKKNGFECEEVYKLLTARNGVINKIRTNHPDIQGLEELEAQITARLEKHPMYMNKKTVEVTYKRQQIFGKVVAGSGFYQPIANLAIYKVNTSGKVKSDTPKTIIGRVNGDGSFKVILPDNTQYIYFEGEKNSRYISREMTDLGTIVLGKKQ